MNLHTKTALILLATLALGIVIGALGSGALRRARIDDFRRQPPAELFLRGLEHDLDLPADVRDSARVIFARYSEQFERIHEQSRDSLHLLMSDLRAELETIIPADQLDRLRPRWLGPGGPPDRPPFDGRGRRLRGMRRRAIDSLPTDSASAVRDDANK